jgi:hypothetical protein
VTEERIERIYERTMDKLDHELLNGLITEAQYDEEVRELDRWIRRQYGARECGND